MSKAERMTEKQMQAFLTTYDFPRDCEHGHFECSTTPRGPCLNEVLIRLGK